MGNAFTRYSDAVNNTTYSLDSRGSYQFLESLPPGLELKEDIFLFHEILNLPFFINDSNHDNTHDSLYPLKKLRWIFCMNKKHLSESLLSEMSAGQMKGLALINCRIKNLDEIINQ